jgi:hypothetical protein
VHPHFGDSTGELSCNFSFVFCFLKKICVFQAAIMPPKKSTRQNSVVNSHVETESHGHSHTMGETRAPGGGHIPGGENPFGGGHVLGGEDVPVGGPQQMALMFEMIKGMQQAQVELVESL